MEITRTAKNTMPEQVQENMGNIDALNNELENRPVGLIDKGDWTRGRHYYPQQVVQYNGASYLCTRSIISYATPDTDPAHFKLFAAGTQGEQGIPGADGNGIASITKISTVGLVDTYRITFTDGTTYDYTVTNGQNGTNGTNGQDGNGIASITKISTVGLVDTYRITFTDGTTYDYTVTNGQDYEPNFVELTTTAERQLTAGQDVNVGGLAGLTLIHSFGNKLTINNYTVVVGNGVSYVKIYARARFYCNTTSTRFDVSALINGQELTYYETNNSSDCKNQYVRYPLEFEAIVPVQENDVINFSVKSSNSNPNNKDVLQTNSLFLVEVVK